MRRTIAPGAYEKPLYHLIARTVKKPSLVLWGCMKGPRPLHIFALASAYAGPGFRFANNVCEPPAAHSAAFEIRSGGMYAARSGPGGRFLYHFLSRPNLGFAGLGFRFCGALWAVLEPPAA